MKLKIQQLRPGAVIPQYASDGAAGFDLHSMGREYAPGFVQTLPATIIEPRSPENRAAAATFVTGLAFEVPKGYVMLIFSRSGHGFKNDARLANCVGVIDSDYRGEVMVRLTNDGDQRLTVNKGDRIAQAVLVAIPRVEFEVVDELSTTERGAGGFGSTGA